MLAAPQIALVQNSFAAVLPVTAAAADDFYRRLFAIAPETRAMFRGDMAEQGRKLFQTLAAALGDRFDAETAAAWVSAYALLSTAMLAAAERPVAGTPAAFARSAAL